jgi:hypothetical protein
MTTLATLYVPRGAPVHAATLMDLPVDGPLSRILEYVVGTHPKAIQALSHTCQFLAKQLSDTYWGREMLLAFKRDVGLVPIEPHWAEYKPVSTKDVLITSPNVGRMRHKAMLAMVTAQLLPIEYTNGTYTRNGAMRYAIIRSHRVTHVSVPTTRIVMAISKRGDRKYGIVYHGRSRTTADAATKLYTRNRHKRVFDQYVSPWFVTNVVVPNTSTFFKLPKRTSCDRCLFVEDCLKSTELAAVYYADVAGDEKKTTALTKRMVSYGMLVGIGAHDPNPIHKSARSPLTFRRMLWTHDSTLAKLSDAGHIRAGWWYTFDADEDCQIYRRMRVQLTTELLALPDCIFPRRCKALYPGFTETEIQDYLTAGCPTPGVYQ